MASAPRLGGGYFRKDYLNSLARGGSVGGFVENAFEEWEKRRDAEWSCIDPEERLRADLAELDAEEVAANPKLDPYDRIKALLPAPFHPFFDQFDQTRLKERLDAIVDKVGWKTLGLLDLDPFKLEAEADRSAWIYAQKHPETDKRYQKGEHRRGRTKKVWRGRLAKDVRKATAYIAAALGATGGQAEKRPLFVADFNVNRYRADQFKSREHMSKLRIVNKADPTSQIPMLEAHKQKKIAEAAKRRMWLDIHEYRAESIGARAIWTTLTLPGEYHPNPTNTIPNENGWNPDLGPQEAMEAIQEKYRQSVNLLRYHKIRPWGFHVVQAQQDSTPHRHGLFFVHDADEEITDQAASDVKVLELARGVVREFRERFPGDYGCDARIIGDDDEEFRPDTGKNGKAETVGSVIRYAARYATRNITDGDGFCEAVGENINGGEGWKTQEEMPASDLERHAVWATERRARLCNMVGLDSRRSPAKVWEAVWKAADRGEIPDDPRMSAAVELMIQARRFLDELLIVQAEYREFKKASREDEEYEAESLAELKRLQRAVTGCAYHSAIMMGLWQDYDLHRNERAWMRDYFDLEPGAALPLAPIPLRSIRQNLFDEDVKQIDGIAAACLVSKGGKDKEKPELNQDQVILTSPDGSWMVVQPSTDTKNQIILRIDEWEILDKHEAKKRADEAQDARLEKHNERMEGLRAAFAAETMAVSPENSVELCNAAHATSDGDMPLALIAFDPRLEATPLALGALPPADPPPV
ncbi:replication endonuclease [Brucella sp. C7-11G]